MRCCLLVGFFANDLRRDEYDKDVNASVCLGFNQKKICNFFFNLIGVKKDEIDI